MDADTITAFSSLFIAVSGFIIAVLTMRRSADKELVEGLQNQLTQEIKLRKEEHEQYVKDRDSLKSELQCETELRAKERKELQDQLDKVVKERDFYKQALFDEQEKHTQEIGKLRTEWGIERDSLKQEIDNLKRQMNRKRKGEA